MLFARRTKVWLRTFGEERSFTRRDNSPSPLFSTFKCLIGRFLRAKSLRNSALLAQSGRATVYNRENYEKVRDIVRSTYNRSTPR